MTRLVRSSATCPLGLMDLGIEKGDKVALLSNTRPEWTYFDFAALSARRHRRPDLPGAPNSPDECPVLLENSDAVAVIVEDNEPDKFHVQPLPKL